MWNLVRGLREVLRARHRVLLPGVRPVPAVLRRRATYQVNACARAARSAQSRLKTFFRVHPGDPGVHHLVPARTSPWRPSASSSGWSSCSRARRRRGCINFQAMCLRYTMRFTPTCCCWSTATRASRSRRPSTPQPQAGAARCLSGVTPETRRRRRRRLLGHRVRQPARGPRRRRAPGLPGPATWPARPPRLARTPATCPGVALEDGVEPVALGPAGAGRARRSSPSRCRRGTSPARSTRARPACAPTRCWSRWRRASIPPPAGASRACWPRTSAATRSASRRSPAPTTPRRSRAARRRRRWSASTSAELCRRLQAALSTPRFRVYANADLVGVELCAAAKNVIAIAAGASDGLGYGDNAKAALMTRGLAEMSRLGAAFGADPRTFAGLAGLGDLVATCCSDHSRNRRAGLLLARGVPPGRPGGAHRHGRRGRRHGADAAPHRPRARARPAADGARVRRARRASRPPRPSRSCSRARPGDEF